MVVRRLMSGTLGLLPALLRKNIRRRLRVIVRRHAGVAIYQHVEGRATSHILMLLIMKRDIGYVIAGQRHWRKDATTAGDDDAIVVGVWLLGQWVTVYVA